MAKSTAAHTVQQFKNRLANDPVWMEKAIVTLYQYQTAEEAEKGTAEVNNKVGFNGVDAYILTSFAQQIQRGRNLSPKQQAIAARKLPKYASQLHRIAYPKK